MRAWPHPFLLKVTENFSHFQDMAYNLDIGLEKQELSLISLHYRSNRIADVMLKSVS